MPRPTKLTPELQVKILERLATGSTIKTTCESVGIGDSTYHMWVAVGKAYANGENHEKMPRKIADRKALSEFAEAVTRAIASGMITAAECFYNGTQPSQTKSVMTETVEETRLRKVKDTDGKIVEEPYTYKRTITRKTTTHMPGDWRAAMEYLARRDPENWARPAPQKTEVSRDGDKIIIKTGMSMDDL